MKQIQAFQKYMLASNTIVKASLFSDPPSQQTLTFARDKTRQELDTSTTKLHHLPVCHIRRRHPCTVKSVFSRLQYIIPVLQT